MSDRRYHCLNCHDNGYLTIFNPFLVRAFRGEWAQIVETNAGAAGLDRRIQLFWRNYSEWPTLGAVNHSALCDCDCKRQRVMREELERFRRGERLNREKVNTAPACSNAAWCRDWSPAWPGPLDDLLFATLKEFYERVPTSLF